MIVLRIFIAEKLAMKKPVLQYSRKELSFVVSQQITSEEFIKFTEEEINEFLKSSVIKSLDMLKLKKIDIKQIEEIKVAIQKIQILSNL